MMNRINIQDQFLNQVRREKIPVNLELVSGSRMAGMRVLSFDNFCLLLEKPGEEVVPILVYKHAVASLRPAEGAGRLRLSAGPPEKEGFRNSPRLSEPRGPREEAPGS